MQKQASWQKRWQYWFDNQFSKGTLALIKWLGLLSAALIVLMGLVVSLLQIAPEGEEPLTFFEAVWRSLMRTLDAGTMGGDAGWGFRIAMFLVTLGGVFIISILIGILTSAVEAKLEDLRKGRSEVVESGHTVILGWSEQVFPIISEIVAANANQKNPCIVILGDADKVSMEDEIGARVAGLGRTRVICRRGSPMDQADLKIASLNSARSIIVLAPADDDPDSQVIKTVLAILNHPERRPQPYHVVAEIYDPKNIEVAKIVGKDEVEWIQVSSFVARVIAQTCRQSGLSVVYTELLDFGGDEIYTRSIPQAVGKTYAESLDLFEKNTVLGLVRNAKAELNPPMQTRITAQDELILIAEDDDKIFADGSPAGKIRKESQAGQADAPAAPEYTLILGWNQSGPAIIQALDSYAAAGSEVVVVSAGGSAKAAADEQCRDLARVRLAFEEGDTTSRRLLDGLGLEKYGHIILLCSDQIPVQRADAQTLVTLLHLRDMVEKHHYSFSIVSEMLDIRNRNLADVTRADDFIVSDRLVSLMVAQVSENKNLSTVFEDIFDPQGSEIYLKPAERYIRLDGPASFYTVVDAARQRGETAIGYRLAAAAKNAAAGYGVHLNPPKSELVEFKAGDKVIVVAND